MTDELPLSATRSGWSVKIRSIHEDEFGKRWLGCDICWSKPYVEVKNSIWIPSLVVISWVHHVLNFTLKSPNTVKKVDPNCITSLRILSRLYWKLLNSVEVWLADIYKTAVQPFLLLMLIWQRRHSGKYEMAICLWHKFHLKYKHTPPLFWLFG